MQFTYSLHKITCAEAFGFDPNAYSRFKFGDEAVAREFGTELARGFIRQYLSRHPVSDQLVVISSPYAFIPTATFAMKNHFVFQLNRWLVEQGFPVVQETKVHRTITYKDDYGALTAAQRMQLIGGDSFHIDREFLTGKTLLFLDDIRITGSHEKMILKMVQDYGLQNDLGLLYFAELTNMDIPPDIENHLNYHQVKSIFDLDAIIKSGHFTINTRIVKYILHSDPADCIIFLQNQTNDFVHLLYNMAIGNNYHAMAFYKDNLEHIREYLFINNHKLIHHGN
ncbi:phosphoribosyltransferase family protein [Chitinophaga nivalis]|uniref:Phosphoribosyltransferase family protein n=1 Tax=Chitinophaga nivalis TaxID=2991709 RepID=A0ABT3IJ53_9BACT|nr:phosphoribosyltransferase family protein [Chitinophaga nivalis]MCW3466321.1 phosphoribosyltransferase family protein [Chitinophaga nivalis]MCW3483988.1 phosphoribosyltransferase family protein [Chitinophaga nivalis]